METSFENIVPEIRITQTILKSVSCRSLIMIKPELSTDEM